MLYIKKYKLDPYNLSYKFAVQMIRKKLYRFI